MNNDPLKEVHVLAGVIVDDAGRILLAQRPSGKDLAGYWEFPGGKIEAGETRFGALARELDEELGIAIPPARPLTRVRHAYPHKRLLLDFWIVRQFTGEARGLDGQLLRWCSVGELWRMPLLPSNEPMLRLLDLPDAITARSGPGYEVVTRVTERQPAQPTGVSCRDALEAERAAAEQADFIVLTRPLPAGELTRLCLALDVPVYAKDLSPAEAWLLGATGSSQLTD